MDPHLTQCRLGRSLHYVGLGPAFDRPGDAYRSKAGFISPSFLCPVVYSSPVWLPVSHAVISCRLLSPPCVCNRGALYFCPGFYLLSFFFYSSPNLSGHRLDVYHTSTHGVALVRISNAGLKCVHTRLAANAGPKKSPKIAISAPSHNFVGPYLRN